MSDTSKTDASRIPVPALVLGLGGLLPFFGGALAVIGAASLPDDVPDQGYFADVLLAYGATILSFLGGVRWGAAMNADPESPLRERFAGELALSVLPPLIAWSTLLMARPIGLGLMAATLLALGLLDMMAAGDTRFPHWYGRLRLVLTLGAVASLGAAGLFLAV